jgi:hypothetical protein
MYKYIQFNKNFLYDDINNIILSYLMPDKNIYRNIYENCLIELKLRLIFGLIFDKNSKLVINF